MPRLEAIKRLGFYPLPERITDLIIQVVRVDKALLGPWTRILDPCAGEGVALSRLAHAWGAEPFAVELSVARAAECAKLVPMMLCGSYRQLQEPDAFASVLYINPPYSDDVSGGRQECQFIRHSTRWLAPGGLLIAVIPELVVSLRAFESVMDAFRLVIPYRFPQPEYLDYNQLVVFAVKKRDGDYSGGYTHYDSEPIAELGRETYPPARGD